MSASDAELVRSADARAFGTPPGRSPPVAPASAVERAAQALEPRRGELLHIHMVGRQFEDGRPDVRWEDESWTRAGTDENRTVQTPPVGPVAETAFAGGIERMWDEEAGRVVERREPRVEAAGTPDGKFRAEALAMLRSPRAEVTGQTRGDTRSCASPRTG